MVEAVVLYGPPQSDAMIGGRTAFFSGGNGLFLVPMLLVPLGIPLGRLIARTGIDFDGLLTRNLLALRLIAVGLLLASIGYYLPWTASPVWLWAPILPGAIAG